MSYFSIVDYMKILSKSNEAPRPVSDEPQAMFLSLIVKIILECFVAAIAENSFVWFRGGLNNL